MSKSASPPVGEDALLYGHSSPAMAWIAAQAGQSPDLGRANSTRPRVVSSAAANGERPLPRLPNGASRDNIAAMQLASRASNAVQDGQAAKPVSDTERAQVLRSTPAARTARAPKMQYNAWPSRAGQHGAAVSVYGYAGYAWEHPMSVEEVATVAARVIAQIRTHGVDSPLLLSSMAPDLSATGTTTLIHALLATYSTDKEMDPAASRAFEDALQFANVYELVALLKWVLARIGCVVAERPMRPTGVPAPPLTDLVMVQERGFLPWKPYLAWRKQEKEQGFPTSAYMAFASSLEPSLARLLDMLLDFFAMVAARSSHNGTPPSVIGRIFGVLLFGLPEDAEFEATYTAYICASNAAEHLILAFMRYHASMASTEAQLPRRLLKHIRNYPQMLPAELSQSSANVHTVSVVPISRFTREYARDLLLESTRRPSPALLSVLGARSAAPLEITQRMRKLLNVDRALGRQAFGDEDASVSMEGDQTRMEKVRSMYWTNFDLQDLVPDPDDSRMDWVAQYDDAILGEAQRDPQVVAKQTGVLRRNDPHVFNNKPLAFPYDTEPVVSQAFEMDDIFPEVWADYLVGNGWSNRDEVVHRNASFAVLQLRVRPANSPGLQMHDALDDAGTWFVFQEHVPRAYRKALDTHGRTVRHSLPMLRKLNRFRMVRAGLAPPSTVCVVNRAAQEAAPTDVQNTFASQPARPSAPLDDASENKRTLRSVLTAPLDAIRSGGQAKEAPARSSWTPLFQPLPKSDVLENDARDQTPQPAPESDWLNKPKAMDTRETASPLKMVPAPVNVRTPEIVPLQGHGTVSASRAEAGSVKDVDYFARDIVTMRSPAEAAEMQGGPRASTEKIVRVNPTTAPGLGGTGEAPAKAILDDAPALPARPAAPLDHARADLVMTSKDVSHVPATASVPVRSVPPSNAKRLSTATNDEFEDAMDTFEDAHTELSDEPAMARDAAPSSALRAVPSVQSHRRQLGIRPSLSKAAIPGLAPVAVAPSRAGPVKAPAEQVPVPWSVQPNGHPIPVQVSHTQRVEAARTARARASKAAAPADEPRMDRLPSSQPIATEHVEVPTQTPKRLGHPTNPFLARSERTPVVAVERSPVAAQRTNVAPFATPARPSPHVPTIQPVPQGTPVPSPEMPVQPAWHPVQSSDQLQHPEWIAEQQAERDAMMSHARSSTEHGMRPIAAQSVKHSPSEASQAELRAGQGILGGIRSRGSSWILKGKKSLRALGSPHISPNMVGIFDSVPDAPGEMQVSERSVPQEHAPYTASPPAHPRQSLGEAPASVRPQVGVRERRAVPSLKDVEGRSRNALSEMETEREQPQHAQVNSATPESASVENAPSSCATAGLGIQNTECVVPVVASAPLQRDVSASAGTFQETSAPRSKRMTLPGGNTSLGFMGAPVKSAAAYAVPTNAPTAPVPVPVSAPTRTDVQPSKAHASIPAIARPVDGAAPSLGGFRPVVFGSAAPTWKLPWERQSTSDSTRAGAPTRPARQTATILEESESNISTDAHAGEPPREANVVAWIDQPPSPATAAARARLPQPDPAFALSPATIAATKFTTEQRSPASVAAARFVPDQATETVAAPRLQKPLAAPISPRIMHTFTSPKLRPAESDPSSSPEEDAETSGELLSAKPVVSLHADQFASPETPPMPLKHMLADELADDEAEDMFYRAGLSLQNVSVSMDAPAEKNVQPLAFNGEQPITGYVTDAAHQRQASIPRDRSFRQGLSVLAGIPRQEAVADSGMDAPTLDTPFAPPAFEAPVSLPAATQAPTSSTPVQDAAPRMADPVEPIATEPPFSAPFATAPYPDDDGYDSDEAFFRRPVFRSTGNRTVSTVTVIDKDGKLRGPTTPQMHSSALGTPEQLISSRHSMLSNTSMERAEDKQGDYATHVPGGF
ncbi:hypothetical protein MVES_002375 [Malassezia vespertilionis]|uniref:Meiotically up-regulated protein Msb1/Mug8 domain-containing protein n=1 Tax=Malassezia vespertilionis TaxID=2020962 RepID=A0A2N1JB29_9BASI|nr:hypothetical protein MVES_002375 [Malassezia vespertilionis]